MNCAVSDAEFRAFAGTFGREESRNITKAALKEAELHLPKLLVAYTEVEAMQKNAMKAASLLTGLLKPFASSLSLISARVFHRQRITAVAGCLIAAHPQG